MNKRITASAILAVLALAACATQQHQEATVAFKVTSPPQFPGHIPLVINRNPSLKVGGSDTPIGLFVLRECNSDKTDCKVGQGKVGADVTLVALGSESATVQVALRVNIGDKQVVESKSETASTLMGRSLGKDMPILTDNQSLTSTVEVPYGAIGRIDMRHGVTFRICVLPGAPFTSQSGCAGKEVVLARQ